jgi:gamma-glutamyltranspeptidase/glutathione hydrolase/leukotriene-C4 hydrolase
MYDLSHFPICFLFSAGIGGGGFMTVRIPRGREQKSEAWTIDFRETAPRLANSTMFVADPSLARSGGLSVCVPGELRGLEEAHRRWGKLPWKTLVEPSIALAKGWRVGPELERRMQVSFSLLSPNNN